MLQFGRQLLASHQGCRQLVAGQQRRGYYRQPVTSISQIKSDFQQFKGGSIDLDKDSKTGIAKLKINHPEKCNALTGSMMCDLHDALQDLESWNHGKGVILHAEPCSKNYFCSGGHLETVREIDSHEKGFQMSTLMNECSRRLRNLPLLTVCLVEGPALGGGAELTSMTDLRLATSDTWVAFVQCKVGVTTGWGGGLTLVRILGYPRAIDLLLSGRKLNLEEGSRIGYFNGEVSKENSLNDANQWLLERVEHCDPMLVKNTKAILRQEIEISDEHKYIPEQEFSARLFAEVWHGPQHKKALERNSKHR